jgi:hypothetical protein
MRAMKNSLKAGAALIGLSMILASCGISGSTPDSSLSIDSARIKTEYFDTANRQYVVCANLSNGSAANQVRVGVYAQGGLASLNIKLLGQTTNQFGGDYNQVFSGAALDFIDGRYSGLFDAPAITTGDSQILPQAIVVKPTPRYVKTVVTSEADRVANGNGGFYAAVTGASITGDMTNTILTLAVPSYVFCSYQSTTTDPV